MFPAKPTYKVPELPVAMLEVIKRHPMKPKENYLDNEFLYGLPEDEILLEDLEDIDEV